MIDKLVGQQYSDTGNTQFYKLGAYNNMDIKGAWDIGNFEFALGAQQCPQPAQPAGGHHQRQNPLGGVNVYDVGQIADRVWISIIMPPPRSVQVSLTAAF